MVSHTWGINKDDHAYKMPEVLIRDLTDVVAAIGSLLLDFGSTAEATFTPHSVSLLQTIGESERLGNFPIRPCVVVRSMLRWVIGGFMLFALLHSATAQDPGLTKLFERSLRGSTSYRCVLPASTQRASASASDVSPGPIILAMAPSAARFANP